MMRLGLKVWRKFLRRWARNAFLPSWRVVLLRWSGLDIGKGVYIADDFLAVTELAEPALIRIGDRASIGPRVTFVTSSHPNDSRIRPFAPVASGPITVEEDAWIGTGAVILPNVRVGRGCVVGANSVVNQDVPPFTVVAGHPARERSRLPVPPEFR